MNIERIEELRAWLRVNERDSWSYPTRLAYSDLLSLLDEHIALKAEVEHRCNQRDAALESVGLLSAELEKARPLLTQADVDHLINGIYNKGDNATWDGGWQTGADNILRMLGIRVWDNLGKIDESEVEKIRALAYREKKGA